MPEATHLQVAVDKRDAIQVPSVAHRGRAPHCGQPAIRCEALPRDGDGRHDEPRSVIGCYQVVGIGGAIEPAVPKGVGSVVYLELGSDFQPWPA